MTPYNKVGFVVVHNALWPYIGAQVILTTVRCLHLSNSLKHFVCIVSFSAEYGGEYNGDVNDLLKNGNFVLCTQLLAKSVCNRKLMASVQAVLES